MTSPASEISSGVWIAPAPVRSALSAPATTNCTIVLDDSGAATIIDPGDDHEPGWQALLTAFEWIGLEASRVSRIIGTHLHIDHIGIAARLQRVTGARFGLHRSEHEALQTGRPAAVLTERLLHDWGVPPQRWDELLRLPRLPSMVDLPDFDEIYEDGQLLHLPGRRLRIIHTPGHTAGHIALLEEVSGVLLTGDAVLPDQNPGIGLGGPQANPLRAYLHSLRSLMEHPHRAAIPGHGTAMPDLQERCRRLLDHQHRRSTEISALLAQDAAATVWSLAERLSWSSAWESTRGPRLRATLLHVVMHLRQLDGTIGDPAAPSSAETPTMPLG